MLLKSLTTGIRVLGHRSRRSLSSSNISDEIYDVVVVGGGVVGSTFACALAESRDFKGLRVGVIEHKAPPSLAEVRKIADPDLRTFAITPASRDVLESVNVWKNIEDFRTGKYNDMRVWDSLGDGKLNFSAAEAGEDTLGWIVENRVLQSALFDRLIEHQHNSRVQLLVGSSVKSVITPFDRDDFSFPGFEYNSSKSPIDDSHLAKIELSDGTVLQTRLVVAADGAHSVARRSAKIGTVGWDYEQVGVVATVKVDNNARTAMQKFLPHGPLALLPLWDDEHCSIVWSTTPSHGEWLLSLDGESFVESLNSVLHATSSQFYEALNGKTVIVNTPHRSLSDVPEDEFAAVDPSLNPSASSDDDFDPDRDVLSAVKIATAPFTRLTGALNSRADASAASAGALVNPLAYNHVPTVLQQLGPKGAFPLRFQQSLSYIRPRFAAIGEAAHSVHPLGGQGLNLGIADARELAISLVKGVSAGADVGSYSALAAYERKQWGHNLVMMGSFDVVKRSFTVGRPAALRVLGLEIDPKGPALELMAALRGTVMSVINSTGLVKKALLHIATGRSGQ